MPTEWWHAHACAWFGHRWRLERDTIVHQYVVCRRCGRREVFRAWPFIGHQPVDMGWVIGGEWTKEFWR